MAAGAVIGVWLGNGLVVLGVLLLAVRVYIARTLARMRHVQTGQPIPALPFSLPNYLARFLPARPQPPSDLIQVALRERRECGPTYVTWRGWTPFVVVCEPEEARRVLNDKGFGKTHMPKDSVLSRVMGSSLVSADGDRWKAQRRAMDPAFKYKKIRTLVPLFASCTRKLINKWGQQLDQPIAVEAGITKLTLDAIGMGGFGYDFGAVEGSVELSKNLKHYYQILRDVFRPSADRKAVEQSIQEFQAFLQHVITTHRAGGCRDERNPDLLDHIIAMGEDGQLTDKEISHNLFLFFLAGHDTSSSALTAALYFFAEHPGMQEKAFQEVQSVLEGRDDFDFAQLSKLEYLAMFLKETLRMRPPVSQTGAAGRTVMADEGAVLGGYVIPKGVSVSPSIAALNYDESQWPDPHTFKPERFAANKQEAKRDIWSFSAGPRVCVGKKFAMTEMLTVLAMLLQQFEFKLVSPDYQWQFRPLGITLRPLDGLPLRVERRRPLRNC